MLKRRFIKHYLNKANIELNDEIKIEDGHLKYKDKTYTLGELMEKGLAKKVYYYKTTQIVQTPEELNDIKPNIGDTLTIEYTNGHQIATHCEIENKWEPIRRNSSNRETITYPSIPILFTKDVPKTDEDQYSSKIDQSSEVYTGKAL